MKWAEQGAAAAKIRAAHTQPRDALRTELWPVSLGLRMVGALPISSDRNTGEHVFRVVSPMLALSVLEYAGILVALGFVHSTEIEQLRSESFDQAVPVLLNILFDLLVVAAPLFYWLEARALAHYLNRWMRLQAEFEHVTGTQLHLGLRRRATSLACVVCIGSVVLEAWYAYQMPGPYDPAMMATSIFQDLLRNLLCVRWHLHCMALVAVSRQALAQLQLEVGHAHGARIMQYRLLWLRLSAQTRDTGTASCYTHGFFLGYLFVTLMLAIYQSAIGARSLDQNSISLVEGAIIACCVFVFCDSAHQATAHVGGEWVAFLLRVRMSPSREVRTQMGDFLETCTVHAPIVTLGDYVLINRSLLVSVSDTRTAGLETMIRDNYYNAQETMIKEQQSLGSFIDYAAGVSVLNKFVLSKSMVHYKTTAIFYLASIWLSGYLGSIFKFLRQMTSAMITYLVVLVQFKMASGVDDDVRKQSPNVTSKTAL